MHRDDGLQSTADVAQVLNWSLLARSSTVMGARREGALYNVAQEAALQPGLLVSSFLNGPRALEAEQERPWPRSRHPIIYRGLLVFVNPCRSERSNGRKE